MSQWKNSEFVYVKPKEESDVAQPRTPLPEGLEDEVCKILGLEKVTNKILSNYLKGNGLKSSGRKLELLNRVIACNENTDDASRQDNNSALEPIVLATEAGVHQEDDLDPDKDDEEDLSNRVQY
jgi:hypothetical protein